MTRLAGFSPSSGGRVIHAHQIQAAGGSGLVALRSCGIAEQAGEPFFWLTTTRHMKEAADDEAHHFVEEAVALEFEFQNVAVFTEIDAMDRTGGFVWQCAALGLRHVAAIGAEADEIVCANEFFAAPA